MNKTRIFLLLLLKGTDRGVSQKMIFATRSFDFQNFKNFVVRLFFLIVDVALNPLEFNVAVMFVIDHSVTSKTSHRKIHFLRLVSITFLFIHYFLSLL